ncbi:hypothetical protein GCM10027404_26590 [Arthrobacter tumbae]
MAAVAAIWIRAVLFMVILFGECVGTVCVVFWGIGAVAARLGATRAGMRLCGLTAGARLVLVAVDAEAAQQRTA